MKDANVSYFNFIHVLNVAYLYKIKWYTASVMQKRILFLNIHIHALFFISIVFN